MNPLQSLGRGLALAGAVLLAVGLILFFAGKIPYLGRLPGDIHIQRKNFSFYFPLATSLLISVILSLILVLLKRR